MVKFTTLDRREIALNPDHIERVERMPETVITLTNGKKVLVRETLDEVVRRMHKHRRAISGAVVHCRCGDRFYRHR
ncbi:MAG: endoflagellar protein [Clostridia bacterium]|nr:MAG: endoflagellar protein [Clostridia bacterium]